MRNEFISIGIFAAASLFVSEVMASPINIGGTHSATEIAKTCANVGGEFSQGAGGYGCINGDKGQVQCTNKGKCTGYTGPASGPARTGVANSRATVGSLLSNPSGPSREGPAVANRAATSGLASQNLSTTRAQINAGGASTAGNASSAVGASGVTNGSRSGSTNRLR